jgi:hypothetical protein
MALRQPFENEFDDPTPLPEGLGVSVLFRPTLTRYVFTVVTDRAERARVGALAPGYLVDRQGTSVGEYDEAEVARAARERALPMAEKITRGS